MILNGDCLLVLPTLPAESVDAVVTDPPYELGFMGKRWDASGIAYNGSLWAEVLRVLKPGGHLLAFGGTRTYHRMACAIEDAGFEVRDSLHWIYGSGFPKSLDVSKAIDKAAGAEREVVGSKLGRAGYSLAKSKGALMFGGIGGSGDPARECAITAPATDAARQWDGWGTALKPAHEPVVVARKPLVGTVADNVQQHGTGALNIDGCRVGMADWGKRPPRTPNAILGGGKGTNLTASEAPEGMGRWPSNLLLSHTPECGESCAEDCAVAEMDRQSGQSKTPTSVTRGAGGQHGAYSPIGAQQNVPSYGDSGGASRFFPVFRYQAKASKSDRGTGNTHPTVKPVALMEWLLTLVVPPGGTVLDPFTGSGTTGVAAVRKGIRFIGIEREAEYAAIARVRIERASAASGTVAPQGDLFAEDGA